MANTSFKVDNGLLVVGDTITYGNVSVNGNVTASGNLTVTGNTVLSSNLSVGRDATITGNATLSSNLSVAGNTTLSSNLSVARAAIITGNATLSSNLAVTQNVSIGGTLTASQILGNINVTNNLSSTNISATNNLTSTNITATGSIFVGSTNIAAKFNSIDSSGATSANTVSVANTTITLNNRKLRFKDTSSVIIRLEDNVDTANISFDLTGVVEGAQGTQGVAGPQGAQGRQGVAGAQGVAGIQGAQGFQGVQGAVGKSGLVYQYSNSVDASAPSDGQFKFNSATPAAVTRLYINDKDRFTNNVESFLLTWDDSTNTTVRGYFEFLEISTNRYGIFRIDSVQTDGAGFIEFVVANISTNFMPTHLNDCSISFTRSGDIGAQGVAGIQGAQGRQGLAGPQGAQGFQGVAGAQGTQGVQGIAGDRYATTSVTSLTIGTGSKSLTVATGLAYTTSQTVRVAFDASNYMEGIITSYTTGTGALVVNSTSTLGSGTYSTWSINLAGTPGTQGPQGVLGAQGAQGFQGVAGAQGLSGAQGAQGILGAQGAQGAQGFQGLSGAQGAQGILGAQGAQGAQGVVGAQGILGAQGAQGAQGVAGAQGAQGSQGINVGVTYTYNNTLYNPGAPVRPGAGVVRMDNTSAASGVSAIAIDDIEYFGVDISSYLLSWDDSTNSQKGYLIIQTSSTNIPLVYSVTSLIDYTGFVQINVTHFSGALPTSGNIVSIGFVRTGNLGAQGAQGILGAQGVIGAQGRQGIEGAQGAQGFQGVQGAPGAGVAVGSSTQLQFNDGGVFGASAALTFDKTISLFGVQGQTVLTSSLTSDALRITQTGTGNVLVVEDITNPDISPLVIDSEGRLISGSGIAYNTAGSNNPWLQLHGVNAGSRPKVGITAWGNPVGIPSTIDFAKSGTSATSVGQHSLVVNNEGLGAINFLGSNGSVFLAGARIEAEVDGSPTSTSPELPAKLLFLTNNGTTDTDPEERMRITATGNVGIATTAPTAKLHVAGDVKFTSNIVDTPIVTTSAARTYADNAAGKVVVVDSASALTITFAAATQSGFAITIIRKGTGNVTISNTSGIIKQNTVNFFTSNISSRYGAATVVYTATNEFVLFGDIE